MSRDVERPMTVLFLCTGNSARSMIAEVLARELSAGRVASFSAGSQPKGAPHPGTLAVLTRHGHDVSGLRSKSWDEFAAPDAPAMDLIVTVCANAAGETCPVWPGGPVSVHWGVPDPAAAQGGPDAVTAAFEAAYAQLHRRVTAFLGLDRDGLGDAAWRAQLSEIGRIDTHGDL